jgi:hypothetical protein
MIRCISSESTALIRQKYNRYIRKCLLIKHEERMLFARRVTFDLYEIIDRNKILIEVLSINGFLDFLDGRIEITDSTGKTWNYKKEPREAQADHKKLYSLISHYEEV